MPENTISLSVEVDFDPNDKALVAALKERIEGIKGVKSVDDHPDTTAVRDLLVDFADAFNLEDYEKDSDDELHDFLKKEIAELIEKVTNVEEQGEYLWALGMRLRHVAEFGQTPMQQVCRDICQEIGEMIKYDFSNVPLLGRDTEPPYTLFGEKEKPKNDGPDVGIWMEDKDNPESVEQTVVVAEYIKGVGRAKRLK
jgi:hypothetical protein